MEGSVKNKLLLSTYVISMIPSIFFNRIERYYLGIFSVKTVRIDFYLMYYTTAINFIILAYCLHYPKGINKLTTRLILIITIIDFVHYALNGKQGFGIAKIGVSTLILLCYELYKKRYGKNTMGI